jgi:hypothetical protein
LPITAIIPQRSFDEDQRLVLFYRQVDASIKEIGLIEPLVVFPSKPGEYLLLDGHVRFEVLKHQGAKTVTCILSTDDEAYTYNRRVNSIPPVAQHLMLLKALESGFTEERIAASLRVDVSVIRRKRDLLKGICEEAVEILQSHKVSGVTFNLLRKVKPLRQIEAAEHMVMCSTYSSAFMKAILYATKTDLLVTPPKNRERSGLPEATKHLLSQESDNLLKDLKALETELGKDALTLAVFQGYVRRITSNPRVKRYLERKHRDMLEALETATAVPSS